MQIKSSRQPRTTRAYSQTLRKEQKLGSLAQALEDENTQCVVREGDKVIVYSSSSESLKKLPISEKSPFDLKKKLVDFIKPKHLERDCAEEYTRYKWWNLGASMLNGVMGFLASQVFLDAQNASYSNSEAVALSGVITGTLGKVTQVAASPLAKLGDGDPRKSYLRSQLMATACTSAGLGVLGAVPTAHFPLFCATAIGNTVGSTIGSAAGANIFSHLVPGPSKGDVVAKGRNQALIASLWGMPFGLALGRAAKAMGLAPGVLAACVLGPLKAFCHFQAASALQMTPAGNKQLAELTSNYLTEGNFQEAPSSNFVDTVKGLFKGRPNDGDLDVSFTSDFQKALGTDVDFTLSEFGPENYLLSIDDNKEVNVALRDDAKSEDALRACLHAKLLQETLRSNLGECLTKLGRTSIDRDLIRLTHGALPTRHEAAEAVSRKGWHLSMHNFELPTVNANWRKTEVPKSQKPVSMRHLRQALKSDPGQSELAQELLTLI